MRSKWVALTGVVLVATVGCSVHPRPAAVVDGRTISPEYVQEAAADLKIDIPANALALIVEAGPYRAAAEERGIDVSADTARTVAIVQGFAAEGLTEATLSAGAVEVVQLVIAFQAISELPDAAEITAAIEDVIRAQDVDINPRFGELSPEDGRVSQLELPWIVTPEPVEEPSTE